MVLSSSLVFIMSQIAQTPNMGFAHACGCITLKLQCRSSIVLIESQIFFLLFMHFKLSIFYELNDFGKWFDSFNSPPLSFPLSPLMDSLLSPSMRNELRI